MTTRVLFHPPPNGIAAAPDRQFDPEALNVAAAAKRAGIGRSKLYDLIRSGELPTVKLGGRRLVLAETLSAFLRTRETFS